MDAIFDEKYQGYNLGIFIKNTSKIINLSFAVDRIESDENGMILDEKYQGYSLGIFIKNCIQNHQSLFCSCRRKSDENGAIFDQNSKAIVLVFSSKIALKSSISLLQLQKKE